MKVLTPFLITVFFMALCPEGICQATGDFQTRAAAGNWSDFNAWDIYNGTAWVAAVSGQVPAATSNVTVQPGQKISVDNASAVCKDLNIKNSGGGTLAFTTAGSILNVKGDFTLAGTANCFGTWNSGAKLVFSGTGDQNWPDNLGAYSVMDLIEINKAGGALKTGNSFKFKSFILTAGDFVVANGADVRGNSATSTIDINGGTWEQIAGATKITFSSSPIGAVKINGGTMLLATSNASPGLMFSTIDVLNGSRLTLNNFGGNFSISASILVDATSTINVAMDALVLPPTVTFNGKINYNNTGAQTIPSATYSYLKLSGTGVKTLGGSTVIPANGTLEMSGVATSPTLLSAGFLTVSASGTNLIYSSTGSQTAKAEEWNPNFENVTINSAATVNMGGLARSIIGSLNLTNGYFDVGTNGSLTLNGASLTRINGFLTATSSSDLTIAGLTGGTVQLPLSSNISFRDLTLSGSRKLMMNGIDNINLNGVFTIGSSATYDNGGESQITNGGGSVVISGKFINRDKDNFTGSNGAIPSIIPVLNNGCTIEYGLTGNQVVTARSDYKNISFSGSGTKTPSSTFTPTGTLMITGSALLDATNHNIGDGTAVTNFTMDGGRLKLGTSGTQPIMDGTYNLTGGVLEFNGSGATTQTIRSPKTYYAIEVTGSNVGNSLGYITLASNGTFTLKTGGTFMINSDAIQGPTGTQTVTVESGGLFRCGNNEGFNGFVPTLGNYSSIHPNIEFINLLPGSTVEYMRAGIQSITNANSLIYQNLTIGGSGNKIAPVGTLTITGNLAKAGSGNFSHNNGTVLLSGSSPQTFAGFTYNNLILSNSTKFTIGNSTIVDSIKINSGAAVSINNYDTIILHSDATKTARVGQVDGGILYGTNSKFRTERYISSRVAWRFLSVATNSAESIKSAWQEGALVASSNPNPGYGTQIIDNNATWASNGFDAMAIAGPSMKTYDPITDTYSGVASTFNPFGPAMGGYMLFIRGDRSATTVGSPATGTVLRSSGTLFTGNQAPINIRSGKIIPINNPFASALDLRKISSSYNLFYYVWDPNRGGLYGLGAFQTLSWNGTGYTVVPGGGSYGAINNFIESGQAFFAGTNGPDTTIQLKEYSKSSATFPIAPFTPVTDALSQLRTNLFALNTDGSAVLADGVLHHFAGFYENGVDGMDGKKFLNSAENLSILSNSNLLVVERRKTVQPGDSIVFNLAGLFMKPYRLELDFKGLESTGMEAYLEDVYLQTRSLLNLDGTSYYDFVVNNEPASVFPGRLKIMFTGVPGVLPLLFTNVKAYRKASEITVEWNVENETLLRQYEVERSVDGINFVKYAALTANSNVSGSYSFIDHTPLKTNNYYRVKGIDINGDYIYSHIVKVFFSQSKEKISIYPNPVTNSVLHLEFHEEQPGIYKIQLFAKTGQLIFSKLLNRSPGASSENIDIKMNVAHGIYSLKISMPDKSKITKEVAY